MGKTQNTRVVSAETGPGRAGDDFFSPLVWRGKLKPGSVVALQTTACALNARVYRLDLGRGALHFVRYDGAGMVAGVTAEDAVTVWVPLDRRVRVSCNGCDPGRNGLVVFGPDSGYHIPSERGRVGVALIVGAEFFREWVGTGWGGRGGRGMAGKFFMIDPGDEAAGVLAEVCGEVLGLIESVAGAVRLADAEMRAEIEGRVMAAFLGCLCGAGGWRARAGAMAQAEVVRAALVFMCERMGGDVCVREVCVAAGCSARTLQYAFLSQLWMTPMACLNLLRLHRVREQLVTWCEWPGMSVKSAALQTGFWDLGHFAASYRRHFGELPSETLALGRAE